MMSRTVCRLSFLYILKKKVSVSEPPTSPTRAFLEPSRLPLRGPEARRAAYTTAQPWRRQGEGKRRVSLYPLVFAKKTPKSERDVEMKCLLDSDGVGCFFLPSDGFSMFCFLAFYLFSSGFSMVVSNGSSNAFFCQL